MYEKSSIWVKMIKIRLTLFHLFFIVSCVITTSSTSLIQIFIHHCCSLTAHFGFLKSSVPTCRWQLWSALKAGKQTHAVICAVYLSSCLSVLGRQDPHKWQISVRQCALSADLDPSVVLCDRPNVPLVKECGNM